MLKQKLKLLKKMKEKGKILFLGKPDLNAIEFLSQHNQIKAVFRKLNEKNLVDKKIKNKNVKTVFYEFFDEIKEKFDFSVVFHEDFMGRKETIELIETAGKKTKTKGKIYFIGKTSRGAKNFQKNMKELFKNAETISIKGGLRLIVSEKKTEIPEKKTGKKEKQLIELNFNGKKFVFESSFGIFSRKKIDKGTELLLENLKKFNEQKVLDFGCGLGTIGIILAKENPEKKILMLDSNAKAVNLAKKNIALNKVKNARAVVSDSFQKINEKFDLIVSNPPTHEKRNFLEKFVLDSKKYLNEKGRIVLVLNKAVFLEKKLNEVFGNHKSLAKGTQHKIIQAQKK